MCVQGETQNIHSQMGSAAKLPNESLGDMILAK